MVYGSEIDISSASPSSQRYAPVDDAIPLFRIKVLISLFVSILVIGLIWVWARSPVYQSSALLQLTLPKTINFSSNAASEKAFLISQYKLTSQGVINQVKSRLLAVAVGVEVDGDTLFSMLRVEGDPSQGLITLKAEGVQKELLLPVMQAWVEVFLVENQPLAPQSSRSLQDNNKKIDEIKLLIQDKRSALNAFSVKYDVDSIRQEEQRVLSKMNNIKSALNVAEQQQLESESLLLALEQSKQAGKPIVSPDVKAKSQQLEQAIREIEQQLRSLSERYTQAYMELDPDVVRKQRRLDQLKQELFELRSNSASLYESEIRQSLAKAQGQVAALNKQRKAIQAEALDAGNRWSDYKSMVSELEHLEQQAESLRTQVIDEEFIRPSVASVDVLEAPSEPVYPIGPKYWRDSGIVLLIAAGGAFLTLLALQLIARRRNPPVQGNTTYTVFQAPPAQMGGSMEQQKKISNVELNGALEHQESSPKSSPYEAPALPNQTPRLLTIEELKLLMVQASNDAEKAIKLVLSGVAPDELMALELSDIDLPERLIHVQGRCQRSLRLGDSLMGSIGTISNDGSQTLWQSLEGDSLCLEDLEALIQIAAEEGGISEPQQVTLDALRHSYLTFLAQQGCKLSSLEAWAGYVAPKQLSWYRGLAQEHSHQIDTLHPALA